MTHVSVGEMFLRVLAAFAAGFVIGWERERHGRPAGLRTNILACVAAALAMIVSEILFVQSAAATGAGSVRADPARLGAGILTGIGFLGAGTILRHENFVRGVTTAATLWLVTVLGLAFGSGQFALGALGLGLALFALLALPSFETHVESDWYATLTVTARLEFVSESALRETIEAQGPKVLTMKLNYDIERQQRELVCELKLKRPQRFEVAQGIVARLAQEPGVLKVSWE